MIEVCQVNQQLPVCSYNHIVGKIASVCNVNVAGKTALDKEPAVLRFHCDHLSNESEHSRIQTTQCEFPRVSIVKTALTKTHLQ